MKANTKQLKLMNMEIVKSSLKKMDSGTKNTIAAATGLSAATCRNILDELLQTGEANEISLGPSTGGRPSRQFVYNENFSHVCAVYIRIEDSKKTLFASVANLRGKVVHEQELHPDEITVENIAALIKNKISLFPEIKTCCIGIPGVVSGGVIDFCDHPDFNGINLEKKLSSELEIPVIIENDMNSTAAGFLEKNTGDNPENIAYLYYPENGGPGCGIIVNGKIINGFTNFAGEVAYLPLGIPVAEHGKTQKDKSSFSLLVAKTLASIICIINPEKIIIAGRMFGSNLNNLVSADLAEIIPKKHRPELLFVPDVHDSYISGLISMALENLTCGLEMVRSSLRGDS